MAEVTFNDIIKPENLAYRKSALMTDNVMHYCPGCGHGTAHQVLAEVLRRRTSRKEPWGSPRWAVQC